MSRRSTARVSCSKRREWALSIAGAIVLRARLRPAPPRGPLLAASGAGAVLGALGRRETASAARSGRRAGPGQPGLQVGGHALLEARSVEGPGVGPERLGLEAVALRLQALHGRRQRLHRLLRE